MYRAQGDGGSTRSSSSAEVKLNFQKCTKFSLPLSLMAQGRAHTHTQTYTKVMRSKQISFAYRATRIPPEEVETAMTTRRGLTPLVPWIDLSLVASFADNSVGRKRQIGPDAQSSRRVVVGAYPNLSAYDKIIKPTVPPVCLVVK